MILITGVIGMGVGGLFVAGGSAVSSTPLVGEALGGIMIVCGAIFLLLGIIELLGGIFAIKRQKFGLVLVGGILGLLSGLASPYMIGSILALVGIILVAISKNEFQ